MGVSSILIFLIIHSSGFTLKTDDILKAAKNYVAVVYGFVAILLITPTLGFVIMELPLRSEPIRGARVQKSNRRLFLLTPFVSLVCS